MAYAVAVYGTDDDTWPAPMVVGPFDTGTLAGAYAHSLPAQYRWHTLYQNQPESAVARQLVEAASCDCDCHEEP